MAKHDTDHEQIGDEIEKLISDLGLYLSQPRVQALNVERVREVQVAFRVISGIILDISPDAKLECVLHELGDGSAVIRIETDEIIVEDTRAFMSTIKNANNFEIYPTANGSIKLAITFDGVMKDVNL